MTQNGNPWRRRVRRGAFGVAAFVLALVLLVTFVPLGGGVKLQAAKLESSNNAAMSSSASRTTHARVALQRIGVVNLSDHPLMHRVTAGVVERMRAAAGMGMEQVVLLEGENWAAAGERLFDLLVVLNMPKHEESGIGPIGRELKATVTAEIGPQAWDSSHGYNDHLTPPIVRFDAHLRLDHTSTTTGYESADARGSLAVADIAEQVAKQVLKKLSELAADDGVMPELPAAFYGTRFEPSHELPLPESPHLRRMYSGPRLMVHNETLWTMPLSEREPLAVLRPLFDELVEAGWRTDTKLSEQESATPYFRVSRKADVVEAYAPRDRVGDDGGKAQRIVIMLRERFSREETSAALQELMDAGAPLSQWVMFENRMSEPQRKALVQRVIGEGTADAELLLTVARVHEREGDTEAALETLNRAALITIHHKNALNVRNRIEEAGRKITGDDKWKPAKPDEPMLRAAGFQLLPDPGESVEATAEVGLSEPANFYAAGEDLRYHSIIVRPSEVPQGVYTLIYATGTIGESGGSSSRSTVHDPQRPWRGGTSFSSDGQVWRVEAVEIGNDRFRVTIQREAR